VIGGMATGTRNGDARCADRAFLTGCILGRGVLSPREPETAAGTESDTELIDSHTLLAGAVPLPPAFNSGCGDSPRPMSTATVHVVEPSVGGLEICLPAGSWNCTLDQF